MNGEMFCICISAFAADIFGQFGSTLAAKLFSRPLESVSNIPESGF